METKKLEKRTAFIFKKKMIIDLDKNQMRKINGGDGTNDGGHSGNPQCDQVKTFQQTVSS